MDIGILNNGGGAETLPVSDQVFAAEYRPGLVHQVVTAYLAGGRSGTRAQKNRAAVRGGGSKPWRQKGTGRARAGTIRSPLWRGGGVVFAARPQNHAQKVNRKMYRGALRAIVSELVRQGRLRVVPAIELEAPKTKGLAAWLDGMGLNDVLILTEALDDKLILASRNLAGVDVMTAREVDPVSLIAFEHLVATEGAVRGLEERLA